jgi:hypothetical protein
VVRFNVEPGLIKTLVQLFGVAEEAASGATSEN